MKKGQNFDLQTYIITILIVVGVLITFGSVAYSMGSDYQTIGGATISNEFSATYNHLDTLKNSTEELEDKLTTTGLGTSSADTEFFGDALNSVKIIKSSYGVIKSMIQDMTITLGIPAYWKDIAIVIIMMLIVTTIIFMMFKSRGK